MSGKNQISNYQFHRLERYHYLAQIKKFPMLDAEEEYMLAKTGEKTAIYNAHKLVAVI